MDASKDWRILRCIDALNDGWVSILHIIQRALHIVGVLRIGRWFTSTLILALEYVSFFVSIKRRGLPFLFHQRSQLFGSQLVFVEHPFSVVHLHSSVCSTSL